MRSPLLTIIVPVYKVETTLERCIESVTSQSFGDWQMMLVDDGSPDTCPAICDRWAEKDARITVIHKENGGLSDARNAGLDRATGRYITFLDSDDYLERDILASLMKMMRSEYDILEYSLIKNAGTGKEETISFSNRTYTDMNDYWLKGRAYMHTYAWNKIYGRSLFESIRFPKGKVFEDVWTLPKLLEKAKYVATTDIVGYHYCANPEGITAKAGGEELKQLLEAHLQNERWLKDETYYMHVLNIQMDVCELTDEKPRLPFMKVHCTNDMSRKMKLKTTALNVLGIERMCKTNAMLHKILRMGK